jgi:hypothetical protein
VIANTTCVMEVVAFAAMAALIGRRSSGTHDSFARLLSMPEHENADRARAERLFRTRELQKADAPKATADYYAAEQAVRDRTRELRRLRLAREVNKKRDLAS